MNSHAWNERDLEVTGLFSRDMDHHGDSGGSGFQFQVNTTTTVINQLRLNAAKQERVSIVILASFNVVVAFATVLGILWDSYKRARRESPGYRFLKSPLRLVRPTETFPLMLCIGIVAQGITFAIAQSKGLSALSILGCETISQLMLPATLITPFIQLVLAVEITVRASLRRPLPARPAWLIWVCAAIIGAGLLTSYLVARFFRPPNFCFVSLFWLLTRWKLGVFIIFTIVTSVLIISCIVIFVRLHQHPEIAFRERLAASRMMYYLTSSLVANLFIIPFFWSLNWSDLQTAGDQPWQLSMAATVVVNVTGMVTGGLYLYLRSDKTSDEFGEKDAEYFDTRAEKRWDGYDDGIYEKSLPQPPRQTLRLQKADSTDALMAQIAQPVSPARPFPPSPINVTPLNQNKVTDELANMPTMDQYYQAPSGKEYAGLNKNNDPRIPAKSRKLSYSIFPTEDPNQNKSMILLPAATYDPGANPQAYLDTLPPPPSLRLPEHHRRKSSVDSTATVQIGLRLSNVNDMPALNPVLNAIDETDINQIHNLNCPKFAAGEIRSKMPSPLALSVLKTRGSEFMDAPIMISDDAPPLPTQTQNTYEDNFGEIRLSPTVYTPDPPKARSKPSTPADENVPKPLFAKKRDWI